MLRPTPRLWWLPALALTWLLTPHSAHAWGNSCGIPLKIDFVIRFDVATTSGSAVRPAAPWYTYFPADPHLTAQAGHNPYPNWPQQWPPAQVPTEQMPPAEQVPAVPTPDKVVPPPFLPKVAPPPVVPMGYWQPRQQQAVMYYPPPALQPTYYAPQEQVPSYWYVR
jgi:hypothetical protein